MCNIKWLGCIISTYCLLRKVSKYIIKNQFLIKSIKFGLQILNDYFLPSKKYCLGILFLFFFKHEDMQWYLMFTQSSISSIILLDIKLVLHRCTYDPTLLTKKASQVTMYFDTQTLAIFSQNFMNIFHTLTVMS